MEREQLERYLSQKEAVSYTHLDVYKRQALHRAGWSHAKIADEMGATVGTIATGLSRIRKEAGDDIKHEIYAEEPKR